MEKQGAPAPLLLRKVRMKLRITTKNQPTSTLAPGHSLHAAVQCVASSTDVVRYDEDADETLDRLLAVWISCSEAMVPLAGQKSLSCQATAQKCASIPSTPALPHFPCLAPLFARSAVQSHVLRHGPYCSALRHALFHTTFNTNHNESRATQEHSDDTSQLWLNQQHNSSAGEHHALWMQTSPRQSPGLPRTIREK
jgi:hypothetical protein